MNALRAFESAGRLQSIRKAAAELIVTPGAVSRQVRLLETWLGVSLFHRDAHSVSLTPAGAQYLAEVTTHLHAIAMATDQVAGTRPDSRLKVRTWTLFSNWLVPRLADFRVQNPWIDLQLVASSQRADFGREDVDIEILGYDSSDASSRLEVDRGDQLTDRSYDAVLALRSELICVCSKEFGEKNGLTHRDDLKRLGDGALLHSLSAPELWSRWLAAAGIEGLNSRHGKVFGDSALTGAAARAGQGVAIVPRAIFEADLESGQLIVPFACDDVDCGFSFYLLAPSDRSRRPQVTAFRDWVCEQAVNV